MYIIRSLSKSALKNQFMWRNLKSWNSLQSGHFKLLTKLNIDGFSRADLRYSKPLKSLADE